MALIDRQIRKRLRRAIKESLEKGVLPTGSVLSTRLKKFGERLDGGPIYRPPPQEEREQFNLGGWNEQMGEVEFDLSVLFEELISQAIGLMRRSNWVETSYRAQRGQLERVISNIDDVLFSLNNADHFLGLSDPLNDMSKMDLAASTEGVLDLREHSILIPPTPLGTQRVRLDHLARRTSSPVRVLDTSGAAVLSASTAVDAPLGNAFKDLSLGWRYDLLLDGDGPGSIQLDFPLTEDEKLVDLTRVSIVPQTESLMLGEVLFSSDKVNYIRFPGEFDEIRMQSAAKEINLDFERTGARYIRVILKKNNPDEVLPGGARRFSFGLGLLAFYRVSRLNEARYQTISLSPDGGTIHQVALEAIESVPLGTSINYSISDETDEFQPIAPLLRSNPSAPQFISFSESKQKNLHLVASSPTLEETVKSVGIYSAGLATDTGDDPIFGSVKVFRGRNAWTEVDAGEDVVEDIRDVWIDFSTKDEQQLYFYHTDIDVASDITYVDPPFNSGLEDPIGRTRLFTSENVVYDPHNGGHLLRPIPGTQINTDSQPKYAVAEVLAHRVDYSITGESVDLNPYRTTRLNHRNVSPSGITVTRDSDGQILTKDVDYALLTYPGTEIPSGYLLQLKNPTNVGVFSSLSVTVDYTLRQDVTDLVVAIQSGNEVILSEEVEADRFDIRYKRQPSGNIIRSSLRVKDRFGNDSTIFKEGEDYTINLRNGKITRMSGGGIEKKVAYIDYQYISTRLTLKTYSTWVFVDQSEPVKIEYQDPQISKITGEKLYLDTLGGRVDLTTALETPSLPRGWHRFTAISNDVTSSSSAINKVLQLKDRDGNAIFAGNLYFAEVRAFRQSMSQVTETRLKYGTRKNDHTNFAITSVGNLLLNFNPGSSSDVTTFRYDPSTDDITEEDEIFDIIYSVRPESAPSSIRLRIDLTRDPDSDPGITPKVLKWSIRLRR